MLGALCLTSLSLATRRTEHKVNNLKKNRVHGVPNRVCSISRAADREPAGTPTQNAVGDLNAP